MKSGRLAAVTKGYQAGSVFGVEPFDSVMGHPRCGMGVTGDGRAKVEAINAPWAGRFGSVGANAAGYAEGTSARWPRSSTETPVPAHRGDC